MMMVVVVVVLDDEVIDLRKKEAQHQEERMRERDGHDVRGRSVDRSIGQFNAKEDLSRLAKRTCGGWTQRQENPEKEVCRRSFSRL